MAVTKLQPAPLKFPNGGGLKQMAKKTPASQKLEVEALKKQHQVELAKLNEKHAKVNAPKQMLRRSKGR